MYMCNPIQLDVFDVFSVFVVYFDMLLRVEFVCLFVNLNCDFRIVFNFIQFDSTSIQTSTQQSTHQKHPNQHLKSD
jgi:hypothetical protein